MKQYKIRFCNIPSRPDVSRIIITPTQQILINKLAAPDAEIIWLLQHLDDRVPFLVTFD